MAIYQPKVKPQLQKPKPHLPRTDFLWRYRKRHACHEKIQRRQISPSSSPSFRYEGAESVTPAMQIEPAVPKAPRLPRKDAAAPNQSQFVAKLPRTSMEVPKASRRPRKDPAVRRQASADIYTETVTPATKRSSGAKSVSSSPSFRGHL